MGNTNQSISNYLYCIKNDQDSIHNKLSNVNIQTLENSSPSESKRSNKPKHNKYNSSYPTEKPNDIYFSSVSQTPSVKKKILSDLKVTKKEDKILFHEDKLESRKQSLNLSSSIILKIDKIDKDNNEKHSKSKLERNSSTAKKLNEITYIIQLKRIQRFLKSRLKHIKSLIENPYLCESQNSINNISNILKDDKNTKYPPDLYKLQPSIIPNSGNQSNFMLRDFKNSNNELKNSQLFNNPNSSNSNESKSNKPVSNFKTLKVLENVANNSHNLSNLNLGCKFYKIRQENDKLKMIRKVLNACEIPNEGNFGIKIYSNTSKVVGFFNEKNETNGAAYYNCYNNSSYKGVFLNNYLSGFGYSQGFGDCCYVGDWKLSKQDGYGIEIWQNGSFYKGTFQSGKKHGLGSYYWKNGASYIGNWERNKMDGEGILKFETGNIFYGFFRNGSMTGFGDFVWSSGKSFSGYYVKDFKEGLGLFYWNNPVEIYFGYWLKGQRDGPAIQITTQGKYFSFWSVGKQLKLFNNKIEASNYCQNSSNMLKKYKKFFNLNLEEIIKVFTKRRDYYAFE